VRIPDFIKMMVRSFPGLGGYQHSYYFEVTRVGSSAGVHTRLKPVCFCDGHLLDSDLTVDRKKKQLRNIALLRTSRHLVDVPRKGDICLLEFPYWKANTAILKGVLYDNALVEPKEGVLKLVGADEIEIGLGEDNAVLASILIARMEEIGDMAVEMGEAGNLGAPLTKYAAALEAWTTQIKPSLELIKSDVKLGKLTKKAI